MRRDTMNGKMLVAIAAVALGAVSWAEIPK